MVYRWMLIFFLVSLLLGCGPSGVKKYPVSGTVKLSDGPLPDGHIVLMPVEGGGAPDADKIVDGKFAFQATPGKKRVEITASRESGPVDPVMGQAPREEYIAAEYNVESKLTAEVTSSGPNTFEFTVTEK